MKELSQALRAYKNFLDKCELVENKARHCMYQAGFDYESINCSYVPGDGLCIELSIDYDDYIIPCRWFFKFFDFNQEINIDNLKRLAI